MLGAEVHGQVDVVVQVRPLAVHVVAHLEPGVPAEREVGSEQRRVPERERDGHEVRAEVGDSRDAAERAGPSRKRAAP